jgi:hypothetical protein
VPEDSNVATEYRVRAVSQVLICKLRRLVACVICAAACATTHAFGQTTAPDDSTRSTPPYSLAAEVQAILGIEESRKDLLVPLANAIHVLKANPGAPNSELEPLVDALNSGPDPHVLNDVVFERVTLAGGFTFESDREWPYGTRLDRDWLAVELFLRAKSMRQEEPRNAARFARASLLMIAHENVILGTYDGPVPLMWARPEYAELADLTDEQSRALVQLVQRDGERVARAGDAAAAAYKALASLSKSANEFTKHEDVERVVILSRSACENAGTIQARYEAVVAAYQLVRLARERMSVAAQTHLRAMLAAWRDDAKDDSKLQRWLTETLDQ